MFTLNCKGRLIALPQPVVMGIINCTPDSFYASSRQQHIDDILSVAEKMVKEGADFLDIGGQSTRPNSQPITAAEELDRILPAITAIHQHFPNTIISVDTFYSAVAEAAIVAGASMINDISAGTIDKQLPAVVAKYQVPFVAMHMKGLPENMQNAPVYENIMKEIVDFFIDRTAALQRAGIHDIIIDPGFGFGKTAAHNFQLLKHLSLLKLLELPILMGLSRKSTIYNTLGVTANEALNGTTALHMLALENGASILRVHDVKEAMEAIKLWVAYREG
jgi:dihydropteroate synthase